MVRAADYWDRAMDPQTYMAQMTMNRELFERRVRETTITEREREVFGRVPLRVLAITEDFCGDSAQFIPPLIRLAEEVESFEVAILLRPEHRELADAYRRRDGYQAIPVLIVLAEDGRELGFVIERPQRAYAEMAAETRRFVKENPHLEGAQRTYAQMPAETRAAVAENMARFRDERQEEWTSWLFDELAAIVEGSAVGEQHAARR